MLSANVSRIRARCRPAKGKVSNRDLAMPVQRFVQTLKCLTCPASPSRRAIVILEKDVLGLWPLGASRACAPQAEPPPRPETARRGLRANRIRPETNKI